MKTIINLINPERSQVKYELTVFPDGEPHIKLEEIDRKKEYRIVCRITNPSELFVLAQVGYILKRQDVIFDIEITYLMSMRMDRVISFNEAFTLQIVAGIINALGAEKVYVFEAHSERVFKEIFNSSSFDPLKNTTEFSNFEREFILNSDNAICFPDHGALDRYSFMVSPQVQTLCINKVRDLENKGIIKSMELESFIEGDISVITIIDDLCDGGGTFCWASSILREKFPNAKIQIFVKHLVNPVGLKKLAETFDAVYITNSYKDWDVTEYPNVHVFKVA